MNYIIALTAGFFAGILGSMGMGGGSVLILYLTLFAGVNQLTAQGINLIFFIPIGALSIILYSKRKIIKYKKLLPFIISGVMSSIPASYIVKHINADVLGKIFGGLVLIYGIIQLFSKENKK